METQTLNEHDRAVLQAQLGRPPRGEVYAASRCPFGELEVVATSPLLDGVEPFPTLYWLTCPVLCAEVGRLEAGDMREHLRVFLKEEGFARELREAEAEYLKERLEMARALGMEKTEELWRGKDGVAGSAAGNLKCLHSHYAHWLARGSNPVGREMATRIGDAQQARCKGTCPPLVIARSAATPVIARSAATKQSSQSTPPKARIASIDAGTNSTRLLLAEVESEQSWPRLRTLKRQMVITRMGRAVDADGRLSPDGLKRTRRVLEEYARVIEANGGAGRLTVVGTSAARDASNASDFTDMVLNIFGVSPRVLSGKEEARLSYAGATYDLAATREALLEWAPLLVVDIGGGSTEFVLGRGDDILYQHSVDVGCVRMSERFLASDPPRPDEIAAMQAEIGRILQPVLDDLRGERIDLLVGLAGTVTTLSAMCLGLREYDGEIIHGSRLTRDEVSEMFKAMAGRDLEGRKAYMGLEPERADVILGGCAVLEGLLLGLGVERLLVSEKDILDGLVIEAWLEGLDGV